MTWGWARSWRTRRSSSLSCETGTGFTDLRQHLAEAAAKDTDREQEARFRTGDRPRLHHPRQWCGCDGHGDRRQHRRRRPVGSRFHRCPSARPRSARSGRVRRHVPRPVTGPRSTSPALRSTKSNVATGCLIRTSATHKPAFAATLSVVDDFPRPVKHNVSVHVYHATSHAHGRLLLLDSAPVAAGSDAHVDVLCETPLHVKVGDRVILRDQDLERTLGGGRVVDLGVPRTRRRSERRRARLRRSRPG